MNSASIIKDYPLVSVVITTWNRCKELEFTLDEVMKQDYPNFELVIVDNHSSDATVEIIRTQFPRVRLIEMPTPSYGPCEAMNIGFANSLGKYIIVLDDDSHPAPDVMKKMVQQFEADEQLGIICFKVIGDWRGEAVFEPWAMRLMTEVPAEVPIFVGCGAGMRTEMLHKIGFYSKVFFTYENELDASIKCHLEGYKIHYYPDIIAYHRNSARLINKSKAIYYCLKNNILIVLKYLPTFVAMRLAISWLLRSGLNALRWKCMSAYRRAIYDVYRQRSAFLQEYKLRPATDRNEIVRFLAPYIDDSGLQKNWKRMIIHIESLLKLH